MMMITVDDAFKTILSAAASTPSRAAVHLLLLMRGPSRADRRIDHKGLLMRWLLMGQVKRFVPASVVVVAHSHLTLLLGHFELD